MSAVDATAVGDMVTYADLKRRLVGALDGRVLEIGAGAGANLGLIAPGTDWVGLEPRRRLRRRLPHEALDGVAEEIPLPDASVDAALATVVLCSVDDQQQAVREIIRVLRPGGRFVFFEHVASPRGTWRRRLQEAWAPCNRIIDRGCDPARETWTTLESAGFAQLDLRWFGRRGQRFIAGTGVA